MVLKMNLTKLNSIKKELRELRATPGSFSKLNKLFNCPAQYKKQYIDKEKTVFIRGEKQQVVGSFLHKVLEECVKKGFIIGYNNVDFLLQWAETLKKEKLLSEDIEYANTFKEQTEAILNRVFFLIGEHGFKPYPELWVSNWIDQTPEQTYGKWTGGKGNLIDPNKFWQGSVDLLLIDKNGWGSRGVIIDYKSYKSGSHKMDKYSNLQLLLYAYLVFIGFPNLESIKYGTAVLPDANIETDGVLLRTECDKYEEIIFEFLNSFINKLGDCKVDGFFPHTKNDFCKYCNWKLACSKNARFQCYNTKGLECGKNVELCTKNCINL